MIKLHRMKVKFLVQGHKWMQLFNTNINKRSFPKPGGAWKRRHMLSQLQRSLANLWCGISTSVRAGTVINKKS